MKWRIKKKKGLIYVPSKKTLKEWIRREIEAEAEALEQKVSKLQLPEEGQGEKP